MDQEGYIVNEGSGSCPINDGAWERWFSTYDEAIQAAIESVKKDTGKYRWEKGWYADVIVYKAKESLINESHGIPGNHLVVFRWKNR